MDDQNEASAERAAAGGRARAERLSPEERSEIARVAAISRWGQGPIATHPGTLVIGDREIGCAVLDDGRRVLTQETVLKALGRAPKPKAGTGIESSKLPAFLLATNLQPFITEELRDLSGAIEYRAVTGRKSVGYNALILPMVCGVYLKARSVTGALLKSQENIARACEVLVLGLARVGIIALVDEATGYQEERAKIELQQILNAYIQAELRPWTKTFPDEFFREIYRLHKWEYKPGTAKRTPYVGHLVNNYIYKQLPPGVLEELRALNPTTDKGWRRHKHHQYLTADTGNVHLDRQISTVTTLLRIADDQTQFEELFDKAFPPPQQRLPLQVPVPKKKAS